jgi:hypothetical protein
MQPRCGLPTAGTALTSAASAPPPPRRVHPPRRPRAPPAPPPRGARAEPRPCRAKWGAGQGDWLGSTFQRFPQLHRMSGAPLGRTASGAHGRSGNPQSTEPTSRETRGPGAEHEGLGRMAHADASRKAPAPAFQNNRAMRGAFLLGHAMRHHSLACVSSFSRRYSIHNK